MKMIAVLILVGFVLVACSGAPQTAGNGTDVKNTPSDEDKVAEKVGSGSSASAEFLKLIGAKANLEWKVAYDFTITDNGNTTKSSMTQYMKTENKIRVDTTFEGGEAQMYVVNKVYTTCSKMDGKWSCFKIDASKEQEQATDKFEKSFEEKPSDYDIAADGTKQVAGVTASCFKVTDKTTSTMVRYCFKDGLPLYMYSEIEGSKTEMIATSYSKSVPDSVFTPPAVAQDMGALTGPAGGGAFDACAACNYLSGADKTDCLASC